MGRKCMALRQVWEHLVDARADDAQLLDMADPEDQSFGVHGPCWAFEFFRSFVAMSAHENIDLNS